MQGLLTDVVEIVVERNG